MKSLMKFVKVIAKIFEVFHWVGAGLMAAIAVCSIAAPQWLGHLMDLSDLQNGAETSVYGFEVALANTAGELNMTILLLFAIGAVIIYALVAMIFRNINLIIKKAENTTPFNNDNIRMIKEIGIFSIAIPVIGLIMSTIIRLVVGVDMVEASVNMSGFVTGIIVLCLTQFFIYGAKLEKDVDGLL